MSSFEVRNDSVDIAAEFPGVDVQITDYYYTGDGGSYDQHFYVIQVTIGKEKYVVDRNYVDFVVLHRNLKKVNVGSNIPDLPLKGAVMIEQLIAREATNFAEQKKLAAKDPAMISSRLSVLDNTKRRSLLQRASSSHIITDIFIVPEDNVEVIPAMGQGLTLYLLELTCHHELLVSEELQNFLDEEVSTMLIPVIPPTLTVFDLVLINQSVRTGTVHRVEEYAFKVPSKHLIVWRFSTQTFDIAFTVEMNGKIKIPLTRYKSHEQAVCGALCVETFSEVVLRWDNTYAKLHAKNLSWSVRIVSLPEYEILHGQAMDCLREKRRFEQQRYCLRRSIVAHAQKLSGVVHGSTVEAQFAEEDYKRNKTLLKEVTKLNEQNQVLLADLEKAEIKIEDLETHRHALVESKHLLSESWTFSNSQLASLEEQVKQLQLLVEDMNLEMEEKDHVVESLHAELDGSRDKIEQICRTIDSVVQSVEPKLNMDLKAYEELKLRFDIRTNRLAQYAREGKISGEGESLCKDVLNDGKQTLSVLQVCQQLLVQVKDIMNKIVIESYDEGEEEEGEEVKAVNDLSDF